MLPLENSYVVLDFDRCTGDTEGIQLLLERVILEETGIEPEVFHARRAEVESTGQTFATIRHVHRLLAEAGSDVSWDYLRTKLLEAARHETLLLPQARELLNLLKAHAIAHGIITYGVEETWQLTKLELTGLLDDVPHLVTRIEEKSKVLAGWKQADGTFLVPPALSGGDDALRVEQIVFLDDKAKSFWGIPEGVFGVHVVAPGGNKLPAQQGELPPGVVDVTGMEGAIKLLFSK